MKPMTLPKFTALKLELSTYNKNEIDMQIKLAHTISAFYPCEAMFDVSVSENENKFYYENCFLKLKHESLDIRIRYDAYRKKYSIYCYSLSRDFKNVTNYTIADEQKKNSRAEKYRSARCEENNRLD